MCSSPWSPLVPASKSLFDQERCSSHRGDTQGAAQQAQQPRGRGQVPLPEAPEEWSGWDILGERGDGDSTGCPLTLANVANVPQEAGEVPDIPRWCREKSHGCEMCVLSPWTATGQ